MPGADKNKLNILVVDDLPINLAQMSRLVEIAGHRTTTAVDATEALNCLRTDLTIDGCLIDLNLPDMDGVHLYRTYLKMAKEGLSRKNIPFVLVTASQDVDRFLEAKKLGFVDIILKPLSIERIEEFIKNVEETGHGSRDNDPLFMAKELESEIEKVVKVILNQKHQAAAKKLGKSLVSAAKRLASIAQ
jgi:CheY-like chemotaxis protein